MICVLFRLTQIMNSITDELIRISVGIEDSQDLIADFQQVSTTLTFKCIT